MSLSVLDSIDHVVKHTENESRKKRQTSVFGSMNKQQQLSYFANCTIKGASNQDMQTYIALYMLQNKEAVLIVASDELANTWKSPQNLLYSDMSQEDKQSIAQRIFSHTSPPKEPYAGKDFTVFILNHILYWDVNKLTSFLITHFPETNIYVCYG